MRMKTEYLVMFEDERGEHHVALRTDNQPRADFILNEYLRFGKTAWIDVLCDGRPVDELTDAEMAGVDVNDR